MNSSFVIWKYQMLLLVRNRFLLAGLVFLIIAGLYGAHYGQHFIHQQNKVIYSVDTLQQHFDDMAIQVLKARENLSSGTEQFPGSEYYHASIAGGKLVVYRPSAFASLSIGQKDTYPFYHETGSGWGTPDLYAVISTEIQNPVKLLAGNFDLAFIIIYLFPLFIIALGYNVLSAEKESSTFTLLRVQGSVKKLLRNKLGFQATLMIAVSIVINVSAFTMNGISFASQGKQMGAWIIITSIYILFWFTLVYLIASLNSTSSANALTLGGLWIILLLLVPSVVHRNISSSHEKELVQSMFNNRGDFPQARDLTCRQLIDSFARLDHYYPIAPMKDTGQVADMFYRQFMANEIQIRANNAIGRAVVESQANEYRRALNLNWINPVFAVQNAFNQVAETEINNYHNYLMAAEKFQTKRRYLLYDYSLQKKQFGLSDFYCLPEFNFKQPVIGPGDSLMLLLPVLSLSFLFLIFSLFNRKAPWS